MIICTAIPHFVILHQWLQTQWLLWMIAIPLSQLMWELNHENLASWSETCPGSDLIYPLPTHKAQKYLLYWIFILYFYNCINCIAVNTQEKFMQQYGTGLLKFIVNLQYKIMCGVCKIMSLLCHCFGCTAHVQIESLSQSSCNKKLSQWLLSDPL